MAQIKTNWGRRLEVGWPSRVDQGVDPGPPVREFTCPACGQRTYSDVDPICVGPFGFAAIGHSPTRMVAEDDTATRLEQMGYGST